ncbi:recombinase family protein, partial [Gemmata sp. JC673]
MTKKFVALARVSSREQEREGFSLDVQVDALRAYAVRNGGEIVKLWRIAETESKADERTTFKEMIRYVRARAGELAGILFYKIDRAARNLPDHVKLEELETKHNVPFISISQPTENTPAGRMMRRTLANMAAFFTEQQSLDVRAGQARRVESGLFMGKAPFGYRNVRVEKRGLVEIHSENGPKVKRIFHLYAFH